MSGGRYKIPVPSSTLTYWNCYELLQAAAHTCQTTRANVITTSLFSAWEVGSRKLQHRVWSRDFGKICEAPASEDVGRTPAQEGEIWLRNSICNNILVQKLSVQAARCPAWGLTECPRSICAAGSTGAHPSSTHRARPYQQIRYRVADRTSLNSPLLVTTLLTISSGCVDFHDFPNQKVGRSHICTKGCCTAGASPSHLVHLEVTLQLKRTTSSEQVGLPPWLSGIFCYGNLGAPMNLGSKFTWICRGKSSSHLVQAKHLFSWQLAGVLSP